jgi:hypothetical protein
MFCPVLLRYVSLVKQERRRAEKGTTVKLVNPLINALSHGKFSKN